MEIKGKTAEDIGDLLAEKIAVSKERAYEKLREKCVDAVKKMVIDMEYETIVSLTEDDLLALTKVTEQLRDLNYRFRFIEVQDSAGNVKENKLAISVAHVK